MGLYKRIADTGKSGKLAPEMSKSAKEKVLRMMDYYLVGDADTLDTLMKEVGEVGTKGQVVALLESTGCFFLSEGRVDGVLVDLIECKELFFYPGLFSGYPESNLLSQFYTRGT